MSPLKTIQTRKDAPAPRIRRPLGIFLTGIMFLLFATPDLSAADGSWMFRRSYFSHATNSADGFQYPQPRSRSAYRAAYVGVNPGFAVTGGYRINRIQLRTGNSVDTTVQYEGWQMMYGK